ncbi:MULTISPECIES: TerD family protein [Streptomyces violaceusniger group]|uniref:TerD family protein n=2 Tax=Streptomyces violaceusniger group TaxID=2839105 RepID=A0ABD5JBL2_9ACTN|nr:TerD family protein [Streptomyces violaceusniger]KUL57897.1 export associated protein [Streptomyces violaceusniger]MEE4585430.1 TerD family protein [Streptomyces sp. DSM 41602]
MTAELVRGQNHPLPQTRLEIRISAGNPIVAGATLGDERGTVHGAEWVAHPASPQLAGIEVPKQAAADHRLAVDLDAMPDHIHRVTVLLALPAGVGGPARFGVMAAPFVAVTGLDGTEIAGYTITDLDSESAVTALELYRRQGAWKVRAVGQGYAGGLAAMLHDQGLAEATDLAARINEAVARGMARSVAQPPPRSEGDGRVRTSAAGVGADPAATTGVGADPAPVQPQTPQQPQGAPATGGPVNYEHPARRTAAPPTPAPTAPPAAPGQPAQPVAGDASGWTMDERLYNQVWGMFEDLARTTAAYRSAVDFAESRMEQELDRVLSDPRTRVGPAADSARADARAKHADLVEQARAALDRDLAQLTAEAEVVEPALPPAYARWDSPVWQAYQVPMEIPMALRVGDLHLPERTDLRIPMLVRLPLERGLWIDAGRSGGFDEGPADSGELRRLAADAAVAIAARLLAVYPAGEIAVHVIDPAGSAAGSFAPLVGSGALAEPPAAGAQGVSSVLAALTRRVDLVQMAVRSGATDALPPDLDTAEQLLIVHDFPHGFDDRAVTQLRYLADEGPAVGVHLVMVADREDARAYGPVLDPLWRSLLRLTPVADDHLADPWVGHAWTYEPSMVPRGSRVLDQVLGEAGRAAKALKAARARPSYGN